MESWRESWREGIAPLLGTRGLTALREALASNDPQLVQAMTTTPPVVDITDPTACEGACAIGFCGWQGEGLSSIGAVKN